MVRCPGRICQKWQLLSKWQHSHISSACSLHRGISFPAQQELPLTKLSKVATHPSPYPQLPAAPQRWCPSNQAAVRKDFPPESMGRMQGKGKNTHQSLSSTSSGLEIPPILKLEMSASKAPAPKKSDISTALCSVPPLPSPRSRGK